MCSINAQQWKSASLCYLPQCCTNVRGQANKSINTINNISIRRTAWDGLLTSCSRDPFKSWILNNFQFAGFVLFVNVCIIHIAWKCYSIKLILPDLVQNGELFICKKSFRSNFSVIIVIATDLKLFGALDNHFLLTVGAICMYCIRDRYIISIHLIFFSDSLAITLYSRWCTVHGI